MKIGYYGDGPWAHQALERITAAPGLSVAFIAARAQNPDPVLKAAALRLDVPFFTERNVNDPAFVARVRGLAPDLQVSMSFDQIFHRPLLEAAPSGMINCHAGALPFYRGRNILNWALINGEDRFGVTVHYVDPGIDTGDIIVQRFSPISDADTYATLLEAATRLCAEALYEAVTAIRDGQATRTPQASLHPVGFYCSRRRPGDEWVDWQWSSERIYNLIRALTLPGPAARTVLDGKVLALLSAEPIPGAPAYIDRPGTVVGRDGSGIVVKTGDTTIRLTGVADVEADGALGAHRLPGYRIGTIFGMDPWQLLEEMRTRVAALERRLAVQAGASDPGKNYPNERLDQDPGAPRSIDPKRH